MPEQPQTPWRQYQEDAAQLFRRMGFEAEVEKDVTGARATHAIDVVVRATLAGLPVLWIVECKHWKTSVPKVHVLALVQVAQDVGADRAILLSEVGFQAGAIAAAANTNVSLSSIEELAALAADGIADASIRRSLTRIKTIEHDVREILTKQRIEMPPPALLDRTITLLGVSMDATITATAALAGRYPVGLPTLSDVEERQFSEDAGVVANALERVVGEIESLVALLDADLQTAAAQKRLEAIELVRLVQAFLAECDALADASATSAEDDHRILARVLDAMRSVGRQADIVRSLPGLEIARAVAPLMHELIDGAYLWVANPARSAAEWVAMRATIEAKCAEVAHASIPALER